MTIRATFALELGLCGFGASGGLVPELRLGVVRVWCCRGSIAAHVERLRIALMRARDEMLPRDDRGRFVRRSEVRDSGWATGPAKPVGRDLPHLAPPRDPRAGPFSP